MPMESAANARAGAPRPRAARLLPILSIATLSVALSACALAPGMRMVEPPPPSAADARPGGEAPHYEIRKNGPGSCTMLPELWSPTVMPQDWNSASRTVR